MDKNIQIRMDLLQLENATVGACKLGHSNVTAPEFVNPIVTTSKVESINVTVFAFKNTTAAVYELVNPTVAASRLENPIVDSYELKFQLCLLTNWKMQL